MGGAETRRVALIPVSVTECLLAGGSQAMTFRKFPVEREASCTGFLACFSTGSSKPLGPVAIAVFFVHELFKSGRLEVAIRGGVPGSSELRFDGRGVQLEVGHEFGVAASLSIVRLFFGLAQVTCDQLASEVVEQRAVMQ